MDNRVDFYDMADYHRNASAIQTKQQLSDEMDVYLTRFELPLPVSIRLCFDRTVQNEKTLNYYRGYLTSFSDINKAIALGLYQLNINQHGKINCALLSANPMRIYELYDNTKDKNLLLSMPTDFTNTQGPANNRTPLIELLKTAQKSVSELTDIPCGLNLLQVIYSPEMLCDLLACRNRDSINEYFGRTLIQFNATHRNLAKICPTPEEQLAFFLTFHDLASRLPELTGTNWSTNASLTDAALAGNSTISAITYMVSVLRTEFQNTFPDAYTQYERLYDAGLISGINILEVMATTNAMPATPLPDLNLT